jgi:cytoskeletal protein CcmA (bactofilin family)
MGIFGGKNTDETGSSNTGNGTAPSAALASHGGPLGAVGAAVKNIARGGGEASGDINALLGQGSEFEGKLTFRGTVRIDGHFKGEIFSDATLIVGEQAVIDAEIDIGTVIVCGLVRGNIRAKELVKLQNPGKVYGDIHTPNLVIEKGCLFEGRCAMQSREQPKLPRGKDQRAIEDPIAASVNLGNNQTMP